MNGVDTKALEKATEALVKIESHERVCSVRYKEISDGQKAIFHKLDELGKNNFNRWMQIAGALIMALLTVIAFLYKAT